MTQPFPSLIGQPQAIQLLTRAVTQGRIAPAYLFAGAPGVGRSLAAQYFAELLLQQSEGIAPQRRRERREEKEGEGEGERERGRGGGNWELGTGNSHFRTRIAQRNHPDLFWVEPTYLHQGKRYSAAEATELGLKRKSPPEIRLEQIREIARFLSRPPLEADRAVVILEDAESMAEAAANGLLKTLEEPGNATLILIAPSPESLLPTLVSRCQRIPFRRLDADSIAQVLTQTGHADILNHPDVLALAQGSPGEAIAHWQQLQAIPPELLAAVMQPPRSLQAALKLANDITKAIDTEAQLWLLDYLQHHYWKTLGQSHTLHHLETARRYLLQYVQPRLVWEVALMEIQS